MCPILRIQGKLNPGNKGDFPRLIQESLCSVRRTLGIASKSHTCKNQTRLFGLTVASGKTLGVRTNASDKA